MERMVSNPLDPFYESDDSSRRKNEAGCQRILGTD